MDQLKSFEFAKDLTTQLITLSTGIIALTITFSKDFLGKVSSSARPVAMAAWGFLFASLLFGIWTLMALTGNLEPVNGPPNLSIRSTNIVIPSMLQVVSFLIGVGVTIAFAVKALPSRAPLRFPHPAADDRAPPNAQVNAPKQVDSVMQEAAVAQVPSTAQPAPTSAQGK